MEGSSDPDNAANNRGFINFEGRAFNVKISSGNAHTRLHVTTVYTSETAGRVIPRA